MKQQYHFDPTVKAYVGSLLKIYRIKAFAVGKKDIEEEMQEIEDFLNEVYDLGRFYKQRYNDSSLNEAHLILKMNELQGEIRRLEEELENLKRNL